MCVSFHDQCLEWGVGTGAGRIGGLRVTLVTTNLEISKICKGQVANIPCYKRGRIRQAK